MENGTVKSFDDAKGYGWIVPSDGTKDLFVHRSNIMGDEVTRLPVDAKVTFDARTNDRGPEAINVTLSK
jgi:cold shock protein